MLTAVELLLVRGCRKQCTSSKKADSMDCSNKPQDRSTMLVQQYQYCKLESAVREEEFLLAKYFQHGSYNLNHLNAREVYYYY